MRKNLMVLLLAQQLFANANVVTLTQEEKKDWNIETKEVQTSNTLKLGSFVAEVITPPQRFHALSLPFDVQIKHLYVAQYDNVHKGKLIAKVTGREWIEIQQRFIADAIELKHHKHSAERKRKLCNEEILPQKECRASDAEYRADIVKTDASKSLLKGYGATKSMIDNLFKNLKITPTLNLYSDSTGAITELPIRSGSSVGAGESMMTIQEDGALWLEAEILFSKAQQLHKNETVTINFHKQKFKSKVLLHAPTINAQSQTQKVRFLLPKSAKFISGMRDNALISTNQSSLSVPKKSVISSGDDDILFVKRAEGFEAIKVEILDEDQKRYYLKKSAKINAPIAVSSVAILKSLLEAKDE